MTTAADLVADTRQHLLSGHREQMNKLAAAISSTSATSISFTYDMRLIKVGSVISIGLERMYVWAVDEAAKTATVERGWDGSTAATHLINTVVRVDARYDDFAIFRALNQDIADLSSPENGLYRTRNVDLTYSASTYGYNLASDMIGAPLAVLGKFTGGTGNWVSLTGWRFNGSADTTDFASGRSLHLDADQGSPGLTIRVVYAAPFTQMTTLADDMQTTVFLPSTCNDIPPLGAAARLAAGRPMRRSDLDAAGSARRSEEVSTQDTLVAPRGLLSARQSRIAAEASRLSALNGDLL